MMKIIFVSIACIYTFQPEEVLQIEKFSASNMESQGPLTP